MRLFLWFSNTVVKVICLPILRMIQWMNESHSRAFYVCLTLNLPFSLKSLGRSNIDLETEPSPFLFQFLCCFCGKSGRAEAIARSSNLLTSIDESRKVTIHQWLRRLLFSLRKDGAFQFLFSSTSLGRREEERKSKLERKEERKADINTP